MEATEWLTAGLVVITGYYAWQSQRTVAEMRRQGRWAQEPRMRLSVDVIGHDHGVVSVNNVGSGPALDLDLVLTFEHEPGVARKTDIREWRANLLGAGDKVSFHFPSAPDEDDLTLQLVAQLFSRVTLGGTVVDSLGTKHSVTDEIANLKEFAVMYKQGGHHIESPDSVKISNAIRSVNRALTDSSHSMTGAALCHLDCRQCGEPLARVVRVHEGHIDFELHENCGSKRTRGNPPPSRQV